MPFSVHTWDCRGRSRCRLGIEAPRPGTVSLTFLQALWGRRGPLPSIL
jgi:hypothetical protein